MQKIIFVKDHKGHKKGDIEFVSSNVCHGLLELGVALVYGKGIAKTISRETKAMRKKMRVAMREMRKPSADKMMRAERPKDKKLGRKKGRYATK